MLRDKDRIAIAKATRCLRSLSGHKTLHAIACLAGLKRIQDAFTEHVKAVLDASKDAEAPGIALFWVPAEHRGAFTTNAQVEAACKALEDENPSLKDSFTTLWPGASDAEVAAAWRHLQELDWRTSTLLLDTPEPAKLRDRFTRFMDRLVAQFLGK